MMLHTVIPRVDRNLSGQVGQKKNVDQNTLSPRLLDINN